MYTLFKNLISYLGIDCCAAHNYLLRTEFWLSLYLQEEAEFWSVCKGGEVVLDLASVEKTPILFYSVFFNLLIAELELSCHHEWLNS